MCLIFNAHCWENSVLCFSRLVVAQFPLEYNNVLVAYIISSFGFLFKRAFIFHLLDLSELSNDLIGLPTLAVDAENKEIPEVDALRWSSQ